MSVQEFVLRLVGMGVGAVLALTGALLFLTANEDTDAGCVCWVLVIAGLLMVGAAFPAAWAPW
jgi:hypothetical protein